MVLSSADQISAIVAAVQRSAMEAGSGWPAADYKLAPASDGEPSRLEIRSELKTTYPQLRTLLSRLLRDVPGLTLRELDIGRASIDVPDIDARVVLVVFMREGSPAPSTPGGAQ